MPWRGHLVNQTSFRIDDLDFHRLLRRRLQLKVQKHIFAAHQPIRSTRREEPHRVLRRLRGHLLQRRDVVENVEASSVRGNHQVMEPLLYHRPRHRRRRQALLELRPASAVVERVVERVSGSGKQQTAAVRILRHIAHISQRPLRQIAADTRPGLAEVGCLIDIGIAIIHQMQIDGNVSRPCFKRRRLNAGHRA